MRYFIYFIIFIVTATVVAGFFVVGSPATERLRRFDERRVNDLQFIQNEIVNFWQRKRGLPNELSNLQDDIRGLRIPADPQTNEPYEYEVLGPEKFRLCAAFNLSSREESVYPKEAARPLIPAEQFYNWEHDAGRVCFDRTIDPDLYRLEKLVD